MNMGLPCAFASAIAFGKSVIGSAAEVALAPSISPQAMSARSFVVVNLILSLSSYNRCGAVAQPCAIRKPHSHCVQMAAAISFKVWRAVSFPFTRRCSSNRRMNPVPGFSFSARPMPSDGLPIIGYVPGIQGAYVATMHSGVSLATIVGQTVTEEITSGRVPPMLAPYRPARFAGADSR